MRNITRNLASNAVAAAAALAIGAFASTGARATAVDLELALVIDVSGSVDSSEYLLQRDGYRQAFLNGGVQSAITSLAPNGGIAVGVYMFSSTAISVIGWTQLTNATDATNFANTIGGLARPSTFAVGSSTNIAHGMLLGIGGIGGNSFEGTRKTMDVSGDGAQNTTLSGNSASIPTVVSLVEAQRDAAALAGITVNGLAIDPLSASGVSGENLGQYYANHVVTAGGVVFAAASFNDFANASLSKIFREISGHDIPEPATLLVFGIGLAGLGFARRRRAA